jgi:hypothetical protein
MRRKEVSKKVSTDLLDLMRMQKGKIYVEQWSFKVKNYRWNQVEIEVISLDH